MRFALLSILALTGCPSDDGAKDDTGGGDNGGDNGGDTGPDCTGRDCWVNVTEQYEGDTTCFDGATWGLGRTVDAAKVGAPTNLSILVEDFQSGDPVLGGAQVSVWYNDIISGTPDVQATANADSGTVTVEVPSCQPTAYKVYTPPEWEETVDTYEFHKVFGPDDTSDTWNSVSTTTARLIPSLLGLEWTPGTGIIAGTAYDCNEDGIYKAQVYIYDENGSSPDTMQIRYFANDLPNADQPYTNTDGLWSAINVPPGVYTVEMWVNDAGTLTLMGSTVLEITPDSVNISNIFTGLQNGVYFPDSCITGT